MVATGYTSTTYFWLGNVVVSATCCFFINHPCAIFLGKLTMKHWIQGIALFSDKLTMFHFDHRRCCHRERLRRGSQDAECLQNFQGPALADEQHHRLPVLRLSKTRYGSIYLGYPQIDVLQWTSMECSIKVDHLGVSPF